MSIRAGWASLDKAILFFFLLFYVGMGHEVFSLGNIPRFSDHDC